MTHPLLRAAAAILREASRAVAFTGAGISVASGISTFREEDGIWARYPVEEYGTAEAFLRDPERVWELFGAVEAELRRARPNPAHEALAHLEAAGRLAAVVTQNIDGLHRRAGSRRVVEYHGTMESGHCPRCGFSVRREEVPPWPPAPRCPSCGAVLKPDVVLFGDPIPAEALAESARLMEAADAVLAVGTTLEVAPASWLVLDASDRGVPVIVVDPRPTRVARNAATVLLEAPAEEVLPALVAALELR